MKEQTTALRQIVRAVTIQSPQQFTFAGRPFTAPAGDHNGSVPPLVKALQEQLYEHAYTRRFEGRLQEAHAPNGNDDMSQLLSHANTGRERWDQGWQISHILPHGQIVVQRPGEERRLWAGEFISEDGPGAPPRLQGQVRIFAPRESLAMQPGFYFAFGEELGDITNMMSCVRFYWNVSVEGVTALLNAWTAAANHYRLPFRFKCTNQRSHFYRLDTAILYVEQRHAHFTIELLRDIYPAVRPSLGEETPLFTRLLAPGLAFAEEPGNGESFGMSRCRLLAQGLWNAFERRAPDELQRLATIRQTFEQEEICWQRPYLRPGSVDNYDFPNYDQ